MYQRANNVRRQVVSLVVVLAVGTVCGWTGAARAECEPQWLPGAGVPGVNGDVRAVTTWDPDGAGPEPELLVVGGLFTVAGDVGANRIAAWDGSQWQPLGTGMGGVDNPWVCALTVYNGELIAGGNFTTAGEHPSAHFARWWGCVVCVGDLNCDGYVDFGDINPFVLRLADPAGWQAAYPCCPLRNGDINGDGVVNFADIDPFVLLLATGGGPCP